MNVTFGSPTRPSYRAYRSRQFADLQLVPTATVGLVRQILTQQGLDPYVVTDTGSLDAQRLVALAFDKIEAHTKLGSVTIDLRAPPDPSSNRMLAYLSPAIVLKGKAGTVTIAPFGMPRSPLSLATIATTVGLGLAAGVLGVALIARSI